MSSCPVSGAPMWPHASLLLSVLSGDPRVGVQEETPLRSEMSSGSSGGSELLAFYTSVTL